MRSKSSLIGLLLGYVVTVGALTLALLPATAYADLNVIPICPSTWNAGTTLHLGLTLEKGSTSPFSTTITKTAVAIHKGNLSISGPFAVPINVILESGICDGCSSFYDSETISNYLSMPLRKISRGTFISVGVAVLNSANKPISEGWCNIEAQ